MWTFLKRRRPEPPPRPGASGIPPEVIEAVCDAMRRHGMHTDASHRFERGLSVQGIDEVLLSASNMEPGNAGAEAGCGAAGCSVTVWAGSCSIGPMKKY